MRKLLANQNLLILALIVTASYVESMTYSYQAPFEAERNCEIIKRRVDETLVESENSYDTPMCFVDGSYSENCTMSICAPQTSYYLNGSLFESYSSHCNGNNLFCGSLASLENLSCKPNDCYCKFGTIKRTIMVDCGDGWFETAGIITKTKEFVFQTFVPTASLRAATFISAAVKPKTINLMVTKGNSTVTVKHFSNSKLVKSQTQMSDGSSKLVFENKENSNLVVAEIDDKPFVIASADQTYPNVTNDDFCYLGHCEYCGSVSSYVKCNGLNLGLMNAVIGILGAILGVLVLYALWVGCLTCLRLYIDYRKTIKAKKIVNNNYSSVPFEEKQDSEEDSHENLNNLFRAKYNSSSKSGPRYNLTLASICLFFVLCDVDAQCTGAITSVSNIYSCVQYNSSYNLCNTVPTLSFDLQGVGSTTCVSLVSNTSDHIADFKISYLSLSAYVSLTTQYFTSGFTPAVTTSRDCFNSGCNGGGNRYGKCSDFYIQGMPEDNPCGELAGTGLSWPGVTGCVSSPGCAWNGCFSCADSINWYRVGFQPVGEWGEVTIPAGSSYVGNVQVEYTDSNGQSSSDTVSSDSPFFSANDYDVQFSGMFISRFFDFGGKKIIKMQNSGVVKIGSANDANVLTPMAVGDIQAQSPASFVDGSRGFSFPSNMVTAAAGGTDTNVQVEGSGFVIVYSYPQLPTTISGYDWTMSSDGKLTTNIPSPGAASVTVRFKKQFSFMQKIMAVCPVASFVSLTGCYSCSMGSKLSFKAHSACLQGSCIISTDSSSRLSPTTVYLTDFDQTFDILTVYNTAEVSDTLYINCGGEKTSIQITGSLVNVPDYVEVSPNVTVGGGSQGSGSGSVFSETSVDTQKIGIIVGSVIGGIAALLLIALIITGGILLIVYYPSIKAVFSGFSSLKSTKSS